MTHNNDAPRAPARGRELPNNVQRLIEIEDAIANIHTQIETAKLTREQDGKPIDPIWFHRARTALRHLRRERAEIVAQQQFSRRRERLKEALIDVLRERHDSATWAEVLAEAQARLEQRGAC